MERPGCSDQGSPTMPCVTISVMPQPLTSRTPKCLATLGEWLAVVNCRKEWAGTGCCASTLVVNLTCEVMVARWGTAADQKRLAEKRGCSTTVPPVKNAARKDQEKPTT